MKTYHVVLQYIRDALHELLLQSLNREGVAPRFIYHLLCIRFTLLSSLSPLSHIIQHPSMAAAYLLLNLRFSCCRSGRSPCNRRRFASIVQIVSPSSSAAWSVENHEPLRHCFAVLVALSSAYCLSHRTSLAGLRYCPEFEKTTEVT